MNIIDTNELETILDEISKSDNPLELLNNLIIEHPYIMNIHKYKFILLKYLLIFKNK